MQALIINALEHAREGGYSSDLMLVGVSSQGSFSVGLKQRSCLPPPYYCPLQLQEEVVLAYQVME